MISPRSQHELMPLRLTKPAELTPHEVATWVELQRQHRPIQSPFLHPHYVQAVAEARGDVEVAVLREGDAAVGFFPFQRDRWSIGHPVGSPLTDFQGFVCCDNAQWDPVLVAQRCGLKAWHFDHLVATQEPLAPHHYVKSDSPYIDLRHGWEAYANQRRAAGSREITATMRKARKLAREVGPLRFVLHTSDTNVFQLHMQWKAEHLKRVNTLEVLRYPWVNSLLQQLRLARSTGFAGVLSALYAGDELVATHLGMRTPDVFHIWFPAYNRCFERYSPGLIFLVRLIQHCASIGIERIDLGKGRQRYKESLKSGVIPLAEGAVTGQPLRRWMSVSWYRGREWLRRSSLRRALQAPKRLVRRVHYWKESI